ncbi:MAG: glutathione S-transferase, partial [Okeania sp. SIO2H7]|nr:glutathione S-transferase [Okeania sp. SIO2H7]
MNSETYRLITIPSSHYCEKVRWALDWLKVPYIEEPHVPIFHRLSTQKYGGTSVPVLATNSGNFVDSTDILRYLNGVETGERKLYPKDAELRQEIDEMVELFDAKLGHNTARWLYYYLVGDREKMRRFWREGTPLLERIGYEIFFPLISKVAQNVLNINEASAAESLLEIEQVFEMVNLRLADGRFYLIGDSFSAADLTFATLTAPVLCPPEYPIELLFLEEWSPVLLETITKFRKTPAGKFALR